MVCGGVCLSNGGKETGSLMHCLVAILAPLVVLVVQLLSKGSVSDQRDGKML